MLKSIKTPFTEMMNCRYPIIGAPMFLVSNQDLVLGVTKAGGIGTTPSLNFRPSDEFGRIIKDIKEKASGGPIGVNIIVNKSNSRQESDLNHALDAGVDLFITSLGNPKEVIHRAHQQGAKVVCDVTNLEHALKVQDLGADGVIAVSSGAGGHAGPISPLVLIPWLKNKLDIPVIAAGGIADGASMAAALALGASAVSVGTRFIACKEASVQQAYKQAIIDATPESIVMSTRISGTPAAVIETDYIKKMGTDLPWLIQQLKKNSLTKKYVVPLIHLTGMKTLQNAADKPTWKTVWSAGQSVGLIDEELSVMEIMEKFVWEYEQSLHNLNATIDQSKEQE